MSVYRNSVLVFIELIEKPNSISLEDWQDLQQWVNNIPSDEEMFNHSVLTIPTLSI
ncbi:hypothetical protein [Planktothrix mougeotii]|uniref:Uncharacterized protein n=1 Tax=Planktothrix mougeotii LEGE 06226 TaxID=1828728 RepID=A0ABR9UJ41_9CYAN|nr:hypothetical protein [Planktothrix mougeotii]MBE9146484.1 hypothetical protein [Planktothrix mougeotii LEGE 06226]